MSVTKEQALEADEFHQGTCTTGNGSTKWLRTGTTGAWVHRPDDFSVPVVREGGYTEGNVNHVNAHTFHTAADCPLNKLAS